MSDFRVECPWCGQIERDEDTIGAPARTPRLVARALQKLTDAELAQRPEPGEWSLREIVAHLADAEVAFGFRIRVTLAEENPAIQTFDEVLWGERLWTVTRSLDVLRRQFTSLRAANLDLLRRLSPADWNRSGRHREMGELSLNQVWGHVLDHDRAHLRQMQDTRKAILTGPETAP